MSVSIAIVGFGRMAQKYYAPALKRLLPNARYAIVDPAEAAREQARRLFPEARCLGALEDLPAAGLDAALVASPPAAHFDAWRVLAAHNVPIFMEKPFPLPGEIAQVAELSRGVSSPFMINFNRRLWAPYQRLLALVTSGEIGNIQAASLQLITDPVKWKRNTDDAGLTGDDGALQDLGGHMVDFAVRLMGSLPATIAAVSSTAAGASGLSLTLKWPDGQTIDARVGYGKAVETIGVAGSSGSVTMHNPHGCMWSGRAIHSTPTLADSLRDLLHISSYALRPDRTITRATTLAALASFLDCLRTGADPQPDLAEAIGIARVVAGAEQSLSLRRPVKLADVGQSLQPSVP